MVFGAVSDGPSRFETLRIIATQGKNATVIVPDRIDPESALRCAPNS